ncbi:hypothetical protein I302_108649 [Kwoniella bestiolae CBS 10118]|uniref:Methionyl-tRNA formyltransferase n=1 Tax=Kwoniella bestiolae CBS 10118 TaxID=1296100 RepID=A0A1B9FTP4_9TREE|nr:methionyl-tRNA formyltransferase [Kwoniella bestiolae CBS 10118]OCF22144.1 methionyl-tRNA formyltransferase [Kwoniella bestiolae CBS 10118]
MTTAIPAQAPLGPLSTLPVEYEPLKQFRILLLVTSINSFTQRVISYLQYLGFEQVSVQLATSDEEMLSAAEGWDADLVLCPFLTKKLPEAIYSRWITLVVHPGPPGDAGPSSLDWVLMGDDGTIPNPSEALDILINKSTSEREPTQRSHWGTICFQANEELDGGAVWAWEQYLLPRIGSITKAQLYQGHHSIGAMSAVIHALCRVYSSTTGANIPKKDWLKVTPKEEWSTRCVSLQQEFMGGKTLDRPLLQSTKRRPNFEVHAAEDSLRILNASDSQPGAMLNPLTSNSKSSLFAYGAHLHRDLSTIPASLYVSLGYESFSEVPNGRIIATRQGAIFIKTRQVSGSSAGIWITHGRVPRGKDKPIDPKIPMVDAIHAAGHGSVLEGVREWEQSTWFEKTGEWQEVFVKSVEEGDGIAQLVYWNFYNGAFTTSNCHYLLKALQWATSPERGNVKILALMGGNYFSNGIALNTIEHAQSPGAETWANINAIDDIVSFLVGDTASEVPEFLQGVEPLCKRGIVTVACVRGNAAAGGVALAAACDVVMASRGVVLNPSYRGMGLHGSELHSYSYLKRCGPVHAATLLRAMKPLNTSLAHEWGLIDIEIGSSTQTSSESEPLFVDSVRTMLTGKAEDMFSPTFQFRCAPWCRPTYTSQDPQSLVSAMCENKLRTYENRDFPPLLHYRNEELSQMLLDCFHPIRSNRYHSRRYKFIRKVKADSTPSRYILHRPEREIKVDEEDTREFDDAPNWTRGEEWGYVGLVAPKSLESSEKTRIDIFYRSESEEPSAIVDSTSHEVPSLTSSSSENAISQPIQRKPSEAPTLLTMPSLSAHPISPTMSTSSSAEGPLPTTPMLVESPPRRVITSATSTSGKMERSTSTSTQSKRLSLFRSHSSSAPVPKVDSQKMMGQFGSTSKEKQKDQEKEKKKGTLKSLKKKFRSVLKGLNGDSSSSKPKSPSVMGPSRSISSNSVRTTTTPVRNTSASTPTKQSGSALSVPSPTTAQQQGTCEWPCLTTGGEEEHVIEGQGQRLKVEQVA